MEPNSSPRSCSKTEVPALNKDHKKTTALASLLERQRKPQQDTAAGQPQLMAQRPCSPIPWSVRKTNSPASPPACHQRDALLVAEIAGGPPLEHLGVRRLIGVRLILDEKRRFGLRFLQLQCATKKITYIMFFCLELTSILHYIIVALI